MTSLKGKTVLLTGASRGLGVYIARTLAKEKATVISVSRSKSGLDKTSDEIRIVGGKGISIPFDITNLTEFPTLVHQINKFVGPVDILINNAAIIISQAFIDYSLEEMQSVVTTNLLAPMELTRLLLPSMLERGTGHIVNIASLAGKKGVTYNSIYSASKAGLIMWSDAVREELAGTGVNLSTICPGYVSRVGMTVDRDLTIPPFAGSIPADVANAVIKALKQNQAEVIVNGGLLNESMTKLLLAIGQIYPPFVNIIYRLIGVGKVNSRHRENLDIGKNRGYAEIRRK